MYKRQELIFYEMVDITRYNTQEMIALLREYLDDNDMGSIEISTVNDAGGFEKGIMPLSTDICNGKIRIGKSGTLEIIGIRFKESRNPYGDSSEAIYPEINICNSHKRPINYYRPKNINEMFDALDEVLKSNNKTPPIPESSSKNDITTESLKTMIHLLELIEFNTRQY